MSRVWRWRLLVALLGAAIAAGGAQARCPPTTGAMDDPGQAGGFSQSKLDAAKADLAGYVARNQIAGAYWIVVRCGREVVRHGVGVRQPGGSAPMSGDTIFRIYSMTKPVVSVTAMTLVEEGKLDLDAPVSLYLPEFATLKVWRADGSWAPATKPMLVRHLLSHTSGLIYGWVDRDSQISKAWAAGGEARRDLTAREYAKLISRLPLASEPGASWNYSVSTDVLGAVVEVAGGKPLDVLVRERVTGPLKMNDTAFWQPEAKRDRFAEPLKRLPGYYEDYAKRPRLLLGGEGLSGTPDDYLRFALMLANEGELDGVRILRKETVQQMLEDQTTPEMRSAGRFLAGPGMGFGLGFSLVRDEALQRPGYGTFAWSGIAGTEFWVDPKNDIVQVFMVQAAELSSELRRKTRDWTYDSLAVVTP